MSAGASRPGTATVRAATSRPETAAVRAAIATETQHGLYIGLHVVEVERPLGDTPLLGIGIPGDDAGETRRLERATVPAPKA